MMAVDVRRQTELLSLDSSALVIITRWTETCWLRKVSTYIWGPLER